MRSKPVYAPLQADARGRYPVMVAVGVGAEALLRVVRELALAAPASLPETRVLLAPEAGAAGTAAETFRRCGLRSVAEFAAPSALLGDLRVVLEQALMGTRLYIAGPESFIGLALRMALQFDLNKDEIRAEACGTLARRVHCVHCRADTEDVRTNIVRCSGCARWLLVRDHYSRRLAGYMGVMADAEAPGELPALQVLYP